jgi:O-succinylbenzoic acid--CoA ligase
VFAAAPWYAGAVPALCVGEQCWCYAELARLAQVRARSLRRLGLAAGQVVVCDAEPGLDLIVLQHALARSGAALLPVRPGLPGSTLSALIRQTGAEWRWLPGPGGGRLVPVRQDATAGISERDQSLAVLIQTSGSGGKPKAVMLTQAAVLASCARINRCLGLGPGDEWLCCLPLQHVGGLAIGYRCALAGATLRLQTGLADGFDATAVAADLARGTVTHLSLVPPMLARLLDAGVQPPPSLRVLLLGGQALHSALARRAVAAGWPLYVTYGMSETCSQIATGPYAAEGAAPTRVGPVLAGVELDCARCDKPPRVLRVRGPMLMAGYANPARRPGDGLCDGWLVTSDLGRVDADGALHILGRADDMLVIGGVNVFPVAVEERLAGASGVDAVAVVGLPHPVWGRTLAACYTGSAVPAEFEGWCRACLPGAERPRLFVHLPELPLLPTGKLDRARLVALTSERVSEEFGACS